MYNPHNHAIAIEKILKAPYQTANEIERNPLEYLESYLDAVYEKSEEKARLIDSFDDKYKKYKNVSLINWNEEDAIQMVKDLRIIMS